MNATTVVDHKPDDEAAAAAAVDTPQPGDALEPEFDYDKAFEEQVAKRAAEKSENNGETQERSAAAPVPTPKPADEASVTPEKPAPAAPAPVDDEFIALLPEEKREAARARFKAAEELVKENERLKHDNRSMAGRVSSFQRKYEEAAGKRPAEVAQAATEEQTAEWKQFAEAYPDIAKAIEIKFAAAKPAANQSVEDLVEFVQEERRTRFLTEAWEAVESVHKGARELAASPQFKEWKSSNAAYERLASSDDIADAIVLFDLYDAHQSKSVPAPAGADPKVVAAAASLAARRDAQAEGAKSAPTRNAAPNANVDMNDESQLFEFYAKKANERVRARYR
ncbi:MAG: hypothetical protein RLZZ403_18 [Pseudomonadota bacterium]